MAETIIRAAGPAPAADQTQSERALSDAGRTIHHDFGTRSMKVGQPDLLSQFRMVESVGADTAANKAWMDMATPMLCIRELDGSPLRTPITKREWEALIVRLGNEGYLALHAALAKLAEQNGPATPDTLKNS